MTSLSLRGHTLGASSLTRSATRLWPASSSKNLEATACIDRAIPVTHGRDYYYLRTELRQHNGFGTDHLRDAVDLYKQTWQDLQIADDLEPDEFLRKHRDGPAVLGSVGLWPSRSWALKAYTKIVASDDIRLALRAARVLGQLGRAATPALDARNSPKSNGDLRLHGHYQREFTVAIQQIRAASQSESSGHSGERHRVSQAKLSQLMCQLKEHEVKADAEELSGDALLPTETLLKQLADRTQYRRGASCWPAGYSR